MDKALRNTSGFTLVEMTIVLVIIGALLAMSLSVGQAQLKVADIKGTNNNIEVVSKALQLYQQKRKRYPCPATYTEVAGDAGYGHETNSTANCAGALEGSNAYMGFVPFKTLGISEQLAYDAWGNRLTYVIDKAHVTNSEFESGSLSIFDAAGNEVTVSSKLGKAIFAVISHGEDEKGAYNASGALVKACGTIASDTANCTPPPSAADPVRVVASYVVDGMNDTSAGYYNDWVNWKGQEQIEPVEVAIGDPVILDKVLMGKTSNNGWFCFVNNTGRLLCSGNDSNGMLANGAAGSSLTFVNESNGFTDWRYIDGDATSGCGIRATGQAYCWGDNSTNQLGNGLGPTDALTPVEIAGDNSGWTSISVNANHGCGIRKGRAYCWGDNTYGQLGNNSTIPSATPVQVYGGGKGWEMIKTGNNFTCGIRKGHAFCWGQNHHGQLGNNTNTSADLTIPTPIPQEVYGMHGDWKYITANSDTSRSGACGIRTSGDLNMGGTAYCWGENTHGRLAANTSSGGMYSRPTIVMGGFTDWVHIHTGNRDTCMVRVNGEAYCGFGSEHIRTGSSLAGTPPTPIQAPPGVEFKYITVTGSGQISPAAVFAVTKTGQLYVWGENQSGEFGNGSATSTYYEFPTLVSGVTAKIP